MSDPAAPQLWNPEHYLAYADLRLRPAMDLLARVALQDAARVTDLGCGPGNVTPYLRQRFAGADIQGIDASLEMLDAARASHGDVAHWVQDDIAHWQPVQPQDVIFSNAALHWLDGHAALFPHLIDCVAPGGVLAVQMPDQFNEPSHVLLREVAADGPWAETLRPLLRPAPVAEVERYYDWLGPQSTSVDIWRTTYIQPLRGNDAVLEWISSTALKPLLEVLRPDQIEPFRATLAAALREAYPPSADGVTLFAFKRLFIIAVKA